MGSDLKMTSIMVESRHVAYIKTLPRGTLSLLVREMLDEKILNENTADPDTLRARGIIKDRRKRQYDLDIAYQKTLPGFVGVIARHGLGRSGIGRKIRISFHEAIKEFCHLNFGYLPTDDDVAAAIRRNFDPYDPRVLQTRVAQAEMETSS